jgi:hypothetical protein
VVLISDSVEDLEDPEDLEAKEQTVKASKTFGKKFKISFLMEQMEKEDLHKVTRELEKERMLQ